ncbi:MAG: DUF5126 domain-containing protein [Prevotella sp.]|jgi:hypothetical protein|nr:DUF5126 domain-containing protein [Prevotella sp.]
MKKYIYSIICLLILLAYSCEEDKLEPLFDDSAPAKVSDIQVENLQGGVKITYVTPNDENLLYVKAVYTLADGSVHEVKSSYYKNSLVLEGFADTISYTANIYSVSRGEKMSEPTPVTFKPLLSPIKIAFASLELTETFGGLRVTFENEAEANLRFSVVTTDTVGDMIQADTYYTKRKDGNFAVRGYQPEERLFGVTIRDRWNNMTDTVYARLTPIYEEQLDKGKFKEVKLPGDTYDGHISSNMTKLWDGKLGTGGGEIFHTKPGSGLPQYFTFDLGGIYSLSRFKLFHRDGTGSDGMYTGGDPKIYEIWGSNDPDSDGGWENWVLLKECESIKPSGKPQGEVTPEDKQFAGVDGEDFEFDDGLGEYRYLRFRTVKVWGALDHMYIAELTFWGKPQDKEEEE